MVSLCHSCIHSIMCSHTIAIVMSQSSRPAMLISLCLYPKSHSIIPKAFNIWVRTHTRSNTASKASPYRVPTTARSCAVRSSMSFSGVDGTFGPPPACLAIICGLNMLSSHNETYAGVKVIAPRGRKWNEWASALEVASNSMNDGHVYRTLSLHIISRWSNLHARMR